MKNNVKRKNISKRKAAIVISGAVMALAAVIVAYIMIPDGIKDIVGIDKGRQTVYYGETLTPEYSVKPNKFKEKKNEIKFEMSDPAVASVDVNGAITAHKIGETVLTLSVMNYKEEVTVEVIPTVKDIENVDNEISIVEGESTVLKPEIVPTEKRFADTAIKYIVEDKEIASIDKSGKIKAKTPGTTKLVIEAGGYEKTVKIIVKNYVAPKRTVEPDHTDNYIIQPDYYYKNDSSSDADYEDEFGEDFLEE